MSRNKKLILAGLILGTVAFGVGAIFFAPLIYLSATCLGGAVAIGQAEFQQSRSRSASDLSLNERNNPDGLSDENLEVDLHIQHRHIHRVGGPLAQPPEYIENQSDCEQKSDAPKARNKL